MWRSTSASSFSLSARSCCSYWRMKSSVTSSGFICSSSTTRCIHAAFSAALLCDITCLSLSRSRFVRMRAAFSAASFASLCQCSSFISCSSCSTAFSRPLCDTPEDDSLRPCKPAGPPTAPAPALDAYLSSSDSQSL